jgi:hypothetical protein
MVKMALNGLPYHIIGFSNRGIDTVTRDGSKVLQRVIGRMKPGEIVLFHDTVHYIPELIEQFIREVKEKGFTIVPLDQLLRLKAYESIHNYPSRVDGVVSSKDGWLAGLNPAARPGMKKTNAPQATA